MEWVLISDVKRSSHTNSTEVHRATRLLACKIQLTLLVRCHIMQIEFVLGFIADIYIYTQLSRAKTL